MPFSKAILEHLTPSPDLLYTQKVRVEVGMRENTVSSLTVSSENVNKLFGDVVKLSSSLQAQSSVAINNTVRHRIVCRNIL